MTMRSSGVRLRGFTLIELTSVLIVIGLIIGAIAIGRDLQRTAEYHKIHNKFIAQWVEAYNQYYTRSGTVVGDSQIEPRFIVGGASLQYPMDGRAGVPGQAIFGLPGRVCEGQGYPQETVGRGDRPVAQDTVLNGRRVDMQLRNLMVRHGIRMPPGRAEGREDRYVYTDSNGNVREIQVCFQWNPPGTASGSGNVMVIRGLTPDLARMLDERIDGKADAREGLFRQQDIDANWIGTHNEPGNEWEANNTILQGATWMDALHIGDATDTDEIQLVTAHYKMNQ